MQVSDTQLFGTKVVNEMRFQYLGDRDNQNPVSTDATLNVQGAFVGGGNSAGFNIDKQDHYELQNYTSVLAGKHMLKFGGGCGQSATPAIRTRTSTARSRLTRWTPTKSPSKALPTA